MRSLSDAVRHLASMVRQRRARHRAGGGAGNKPRLSCEWLETRCLLDCSPDVHMDNPVLQAEHLAVCDLVKDDLVTNTVIRNGNWSNSATWQGGLIPGPGANVLIPEGLTATVDAVLSQTLHTVRVDGTLQFDPARNTGLLVDTIVVTSMGN